jgi:hypothetical protein
MKLEPVLILDTVNMSKRNRLFKMHNSCGLVATLQHEGNGMVLKHGKKYNESTTSMSQPIKVKHFPIQYISLYSHQIIKM